MKIPNYDTKSPTQGRSLCNFLDEDFRLLISGQSGCGKTNTVMHILRKPLVYYDKIHFSPPINTRTKLLTSKSDETHFEKSRVRSFLNCIPRRKSWTHQNTQATTEKSLFLMTLLMHLIEFNQKLQTIGQMAGITEFLRFYLSQSYYDVPQKIRLNCSHMILYPPATKKHVDLIAKENLVQPNLFNKLGPFEFLFLDKEKKSVAKNFDERI